MINVYMRRSIRQMEMIMENDSLRENRKNMIFMSFSINFKYKVIGSIFCDSDIQIEAVGVLKLHILFAISLIRNII